MKIQVIKTSKFEMNFDSKMTERFWKFEHDMLNFKEASHFSLTLSVEILILGFILMDSTWMVNCSKYMGGQSRRTGGWVEGSVVISAMFSRLSIIALLCTQTQMMIVSQPQAFQLLLRQTFSLAPFFMCLQPQQKPQSGKSSQEKCNHVITFCFCGQLWLLPWFEWLAFTNKSTIIFFGNLKNHMVSEKVLSFSSTTICILTKLHLCTKHINDLIPLGVVPYVYLSTFHVI